MSVSILVVLCLALTSQYVWAQSRLRGRGRAPTLTVSVNSTASLSFPIPAITSGGILILAPTGRVILTLEPDGRVSNASQEYETRYHYTGSEGRMAFTLSDVQSRDTGSYRCVFLRGRLELYMISRCGQRLVVSG